MKIKKIFLFFVCFLFAFLPACGEKSTSKAPLVRVVTAVEIQGREKEVMFSRCYTTPQKMQPILIYLRTLDPDIRPVATEKIRPINATQIKLKFSDGKEKNYYQIAHKFISENYKFSYSIEPAKTAELYRLISLLPTDSV